MEKSILKQHVSLFENYKSAIPKGTISLEEWLFSDVFKEEIMDIRQCDDDDRKRQLKMRLPAITPSGIFTARNSNALEKHSGLICVDIDGKSNPQIKDWQKAKKQLSEIAQIAYCGLSVSGNGIFAIIPVQDPPLHLDYFFALEKYFREAQQIVIDPSCKDVSRLRGISYDPCPVINREAIPLKVGLKMNEVLAKETKQTGDEVQSLLAILNSIKEQQLDITENYPDWFQVGVVIAKILGESGRTHYHDISQLNGKYNQRECDRQYTACLKRCYNYSIGTLKYLLQKYG